MIETSNRIKKYKFTITPSSGAGSYTFPLEGALGLTGTVIHRSVKPTTSTTTFTYFVQNGDSENHDYYSGTGFNIFNGEALYLNETTFQLSGTSVDELFTIEIWIRK